MTLKQTMLALKKKGTAQNRKVYARHGAGENLFGVSFANLKQLKKEIKTDHDLATQLWGTGNVDAMSLATMIADPSLFTATSTDEWLAAVDYHLLADLLGGVIARSSIAAKKIGKWTRSRKEYVKTAGYVVLSHVLKDSPDLLDEDHCRQHLDTIEAEIHEAPNRARQSMNMAVIAIGIYKPTLRKKAIATAKRIGKVDVDHGETGCKTPEAVAYINKAVTRMKSTGKPPARRGGC